MEVQDSDSCNLLGGLQGAAAGDNLNFGVKGSGCSAPTSHDLSVALFMEGVSTLPGSRASDFINTMVNSLTLELGFVAAPL